MITLMVAVIANCAVFILSNSGVDSCCPHDVTVIEVFVETTHHPVESLILQPLDICAVASVVVQAHLFQEKTCSSQPGPRMQNSFRNLKIYLCLEILEYFVFSLFLSFKTKL